MLSVDLLKKMPFASIDLHFAAYIQEQSESDDPAVFAAAAIASAAVRQGHTCCDLICFQGKKFSDFFRTIVSENEELESDTDEAFPAIEHLRTVLNPPVGIVLEKWSDEEKSKNIPLILDPEGRLYLNRYFLYEKELAERILQFVKQPEREFSPQKKDFNGIISFFNLAPGKSGTNRLAEICGISFRNFPADRHHWRSRNGKNNGRCCVACFDPGKICKRNSGKFSENPALCAHRKSTKPSGRIYPEQFEKLMFERFAMLAGSQSGIGMDH